MVKGHHPFQMEIRVGLRRYNLRTWDMDMAVAFRRMNGTGSNKHHTPRFKPLPSPNLHHSLVNSESSRANHVC